MNSMNSFVEEANSDKEITKIINLIPCLKQRQYSTKAQLYQLHRIAISLGLNDANIVIQKIMLHENT